MAHGLRRFSHLSKEWLDFGWRPSKAGDGVKADRLAAFFPDTPPVMIWSGVAVVTGQSGPDHHRTSTNMNPESTASVTHGQRILLTNASERADGACDASPRPDSQAAQKSIASLIEQRLVREMRAKVGMPVWRDDDNGRSLALIITKRGRDAIRIVADASSGPPDSRAGHGEPIDGPHQPREGSKIAAVIALLSRNTGASLPDLVAVTGWLPHTTRAALTGLRKRGYDVTRARQEEGGTVY